MIHRLLAVCSCMVMAFYAEAQNYHAIQGSSYAGALGVHNNPASIVNTPFKWDLALFGVQLKSSTNAFSIHNYSLLSSPAKSLYRLDKGAYKRKANLDMNLNLLNARIALNRKSGIAFGANIRSYSNLHTAPYNFIDTLENSSEFLKINQDIQSVNGKFASSSCLEVYISYARTIADNEFGRLNAGISVRVSRGISGAYAHINNISGSPNNITAADIIYGYSSNYDRWQNSNSSSQNINNFFGYTEGGASIDAGIEYLIKPQGTTSFYDDENYDDYDWKLGLSLSAFDLPTVFKNVI